MIVPNKLAAVLPKIFSGPMTKILLVFALMIVSDLCKHASSMAFAVAVGPKSLVDSVAVFVDHPSHSMRSLGFHVQNPGITTIRERRKVSGTMHIWIMTRKVNDDNAE